ncbi:MAG: hypothetical protein MJK04_04190 [Psychrosphaera sp.]|nr:hypothetical protein [Psychrosphaera sp.]
MNKILMATIVTLCLSGCAIHIGNLEPTAGENASVTMGNIEVADNQHAGKLEATNGNVTLGHSARAGKIEVMNGNIELADFSQTQSLETVNGNIEAGANVRVNGKAETVNGNIMFGQSATIGGSLSTTSGSISLGQNSKVDGNIVFEEVNGWGSIKNGNKPKLELGQGVIFYWQILLYQPVTVLLPDSVDPNKVVRHYSDE